MREAQKQAYDRIQNAKFDLQYEAMCRERGIVPKLTADKKPI
jgi:hypothetical protein